MPDEASLFQTTGLPWAQRAELPELEAVLAPGGSSRRNSFLHGIHLFAARRALRAFGRSSRIVDFGCGTGRLTKFFSSHGCRVVGTEVTPEMIERAKTSCDSAQCEFLLTDGVKLSLPSSSVDGVWCCGVLRYSLFVKNPAYAKIAREMYRILRPGGCVVNCEIYVDADFGVFSKDFEAAGFTTQYIRVLHRYGSRFENISIHRLFPERLVSALGTISASLYSQFDDPQCDVPGLRDYLFVWQKPVNRPKRVQA